MRTRQLPIGGLYTLEHCTDGWYFQQLQSAEPWQGPYRYNEIFAAVAEEMEAEATYLYELLHKEAPR